MKITSFINSFVWSISLLCLSIFWTGCENNNADGAGGTPTTTSTHKDAITIYTSAPRPGIQAMLEKFTQENTLPLNIVVKPENTLRESFVEASSQGKADLLLTNQLADMLRLQRTADIRTMNSKILDESVSDKNKAPGSNWAIIGGDVYVLAGLRDRVTPDELSLYESLVNDKWRDRLLLPGLADMELFVAQMIVDKGEDATRQWVSKAAANLAKPPIDDPYDLVHALGAGEGDVALLSAAAQIGLHRSGNPVEDEIGDRIGIQIPRNSSGASYINATAIAISGRTVKDRAALIPIDYFLQEDNQKTLAHSSHLNPSHIYAEPNDFVLQIGGWNPATTDWFAIEDQLDKAREMLLSVGWKQ